LENEVHEAWLSFGKLNQSSGSRVVSFGWIVDLSKNGIREDGVDLESK